MQWSKFSKVALWKTIYLRVSCGALKGMNLNTQVLRGFYCVEWSAVLIGLFITSHDPSLEILRVLVPL